MLNKCLDEEVQRNYYKIYHRYFKCASFLEDYFNDKISKSYLLHIVQKYDLNTIEKIIADSLRKYEVVNENTNLIPKSSIILNKDYLENRKGVVVELPFIFENTKKYNIIKGLVMLDEVLMEFMPDNLLLQQMFEYGYTYASMLPISRKIARELFDNTDLDIYTLYDDNSEALVESTEDLVLDDVMYGVIKNEWERYYFNKGAKYDCI